MSSQEVTSVSWSHWNVRECKEAELLQKSFNVTVEKWSPRDVTVGGAQTESKFQLILC